MIADKDELLGSFRERHKNVTLKHLAGFFNDDDTQIDERRKLRILRSGCRRIADCMLGLY
jgi:hypothetical protein